MSGVFSDAALQAAIQKTMAAKVTQSEPDQREHVGVAPYAALAAGNAADTLTTWQAIRSGRGHEANPGLPVNPAKIALIKTLATIPEMLAMRYVGQHSPKMAKGLGYALGALGGGLALHNAHVGR